MRRYGFDRFSVHRARASKAKSAILLTHSMEESEALCERVGIFVAGSLRNIGTPAQLKYKFGEFFKLTMTTTNAEDQDIAFEEIKKVAPKAFIFNEPALGSRNYQLPRSQAKLSELFELAGFRQSAII